MRTHDETLTLALADPCRIVVTVQEASVRGDVLDVTWGLGVTCRIAYPAPSPKPGEMLIVWGSTENRAGTLTRGVAVIRASGVHVFAYQTAEEMEAWKQEELRRIEHRMALSGIAALMQGRPTSSAERVTLTQAGVLAGGELAEAVRLGWEAAGRREWSSTAPTEEGWYPWRRKGWVEEEVCRLVPCGGGHLVSTSRGRREIEPGDQWGPRILFPGEETP